MKRLLDYRPPEPTSTPIGAELRAADLQMAALTVIAEAERSLPAGDLGTVVRKRNTVRVFMEVGRSHILVVAAYSTNEEENRLLTELQGEFDT